MLGRTQTLPGLLGNLFGKVKSCYISMKKNDKNSRLPTLGPNISAHMYLCTYSRHSGPVGCLPAPNIFPLAKETFAEGKMLGLASILRDLSASLIINFHYNFRKELKRSLTRTMTLRSFQKCYDH